MESAKYLPALPAALPVGDPTLSDFRDCVGDEIRSLSGNLDMEACLWAESMMLNPGMIGGQKSGFVWGVGSRDLAASTIQLAGDRV